MKLIFWIIALLIVQNVFTIDCGYVPEGSSTYYSTFLAYSYYDGPILMVRCGGIIRHATKPVPGFINCTTYASNVTCWCLSDFSMKQNDLALYYGLLYHVGCDLNILQCFAAGNITTGCETQHVTFPTVEVGSAYTYTTLAQVATTYFPHITTPYTFKHARTAFFPIYNGTTLVYVNLTLNVLFDGYIKTPVNYYTIKLYDEVYTSNGLYFAYPNMYMYSTSNLAIIDMANTVFPSNFSMFQVQIRETLASKLLFTTVDAFVYLYFVTLLGFADPVRCYANINICYGRSTYFYERIYNVNLNNAELHFYRELNAYHNNTLADVPTIAQHFDLRISGIGGSNNKVNIYHTVTDRFCHPIRTLTIDYLFVDDLYVDYGTVTIWSDAYYNYYRNTLLLPIDDALLQSEFVVFGNIDYNQVQHIMEISGNFYFLSTQYNLLSETLHTQTGANGKLIVLPSLMVQAVTLSVTVRFNTVVLYGLCRTLAFTDPVCYKSGIYIGPLLTNRVIDYTLGGNTVDAGMGVEAGLYFYSLNTIDFSLSFLTIPNEDAYQEVPYTIKYFDPNVLGRLYDIQIYYFASYDPSFDQCAHVCKGDCLQTYVDKFDISPTNTGVCYGKTRFTSVRDTSLNTKHANIQVSPDTYDEVLATDTVTQRWYGSSSLAQRTTIQQGLGAELVPGDPSSWSNHLFFTDTLIFDNIEFQLLRPSINSKGTLFKTLKDMVLLRFNYCLLQGMYVYDLLFEEKVVPETVQTFEMLYTTVKNFAGPVHPVSSTNLVVSNTYGRNLKQSILTTVHQNIVSQNNHFEYIAVATETMSSQLMYGLPTTAVTAIQNNTVYTHNIALPVNYPTFFSYAEYSLFTLNNVRVGFALDQFKGNGTDFGLTYRDIFDLAGVPIPCDIPTLKSIRALQPNLKGKIGVVRCFDVNGNRSYCTKTVCSDKLDYLPPYCVVNKSVPTTDELFGAMYFHTMKDALECRNAPAGSEVILIYVVGSNQVGFSATPDFVEEDLYFYTSRYQGYLFVGINNPVVSAKNWNFANKKLILEHMTIDNTGPAGSMLLNFVNPLYYLRLHQVGIRSGKIALTYFELNGTASITDSTFQCGLFCFDLLGQPYSKATVVFNNNVFERVESSALVTRNIQSLNVENNVCTGACGMMVDEDTSVYTKSLYYFSNSPSVKNVSYIIKNNVAQYNDSVNQIYGFPFSSGRYYSGLTIDGLFAPILSLFVQDNAFRGYPVNIRWFGTMDPVLKLAQHRPVLINDERELVRQIWIENPLSYDLNAKTSIFHDVILASMNNDIINYTISKFCDAGCPTSSDACFVSEDYVLEPLLGVVFFLTLQSAIDNCQLIPKKIVITKRVHEHVSIQEEVTISGPFSGTMEILTLEPVVLTGMDIIHEGSTFVPTITGVVYNLEITDTQFFGMPGVPSITNVTANGRVVLRNIRTDGYFYNGFYFNYLNCVPSNQITVENVVIGYATGFGLKVENAYYWNYRNVSVLSCACTSSERFCLFLSTCYVGKPNSIIQSSVTGRPPFAATTTDFLCSAYAVNVTIRPMLPKTTQLPIVDLSGTGYPVCYRVLGIAMGPMVLDPKFYIRPYSTSNPLCIGTSFDVVATNFEQELVMIVKPYLTEIIPLYSNGGSPFTVSPLIAVPVGAVLILILCGLLGCWNLCFGRNVYYTKTKKKLKSKII